MMKRLDEPVKKMTGVRFACGVLAASMIGAVAMAQDLPLTQGFMRNQMHPLDPTRDITNPVMESTLHKPLPEQYIWTAADATAAGEKLVYTFPGSWCGVPTLGADCTRCLPGIRA